MGRVKRGNVKKAFMREHDCRFCLYFGSCAHKECVFDDTEADGGKHGQSSCDAEKRGADMDDETI